MLARIFVLVTRRFGSLDMCSQYLARSWMVVVVVHTQADCFQAWLARLAATAAGTPQLSKLGRQVLYDRVCCVRGVSVVVATQEQQLYTIIRKHGCRRCCGFNVQGRLEFGESRWTKCTRSTKYDVLQPDSTRRSKNR